MCLMGNLTIIDITGLSPFAREDVFGGASAFQRCLDWAKNIPDWGGTILLAGSSDELPADCETVSLDFPGDSELRAVVRDQWNEEELISSLDEASRLKLTTGKHRGNNPEAIFFIRGDSPLIDTEVSNTLWKLHYRYDAEYTFADGYPVGLAPEILGPGVAGRLKALATGRKGTIARNSIFEVLRQDINAFDVETHLSPEDLRMDRVSVTCDTKRNIAIAEKLMAAGGRNAETICALLPENRSILRNLPAFFPIQITDHCPQACSYCPFTLDSDPRKGTAHMPADKFAELCKKIVDFTGDAVFNLSMWGEPASHPEIGKLIRSALAAGEQGWGVPVSKVIIETSGIGWDESLLQELASEYPDGRLMWIVSLDASDSSLYTSLRGEGQIEAEKTAGTLSDLFGRYCWLQAVRMNENEEHLDGFYKKWNGEGRQVIIQKYDSYGELLPERQPADLSPLNRVACWHLKRDMCVLLDGSVPVCRVMMGREQALGNVFEQNLSDIWARGEELYQEHVSGKYPGPCEKCDEYYTFNF